MSPCRAKKKKKNLKVTFTLKASCITSCLHPGRQLDTITSINTGEFAGSQLGYLAFDHSNWLFTLTCTTTCVAPAFSPPAFTDSFHQDRSGLLVSVWLLELFASATLTVMLCVRVCLVPSRYIEQAPRMRPLCLKMHFGVWNKFSALLCLAAIRSI